MWSYQHQYFTVHQLPVLQDNYIYLIDAHQSDNLIVVDPARSMDVQQACNTLNKKPTHVFNTHHHWDHTDGNTSLKKTYNCLIVGAQNDAIRIPAIDLKVSDANPIHIGNLTIQVIDVPGHTIGHIAFVIDDALFCGDTLFGAGCGRLFEGSPAQMLASLSKLADLNPQTKIYCAHEYTMANLHFAHSIDPNNKKLSKRMLDDSKLRQHKQPTVPSTIGMEIATNPMLRPLDTAFCQTYAASENLEQHDALTVFSNIRHKKDNW